MAYSVVGGGNSAYIPSTNDIAGGALQVEFTRSANSFPITKYATLVPVSKMTGFYLRQDPRDNIRIPSEAEYAWPLGSDRPIGRQNAFDFVQFTAQRYSFPFYIPQETSAQASWDVVAQHARSKAQLAMTRRTVSAATALSTQANWDLNYSASATALGAGSWLASSEANGFIQKSIQLVMQKVGFSSGGAVGGSQLMMVISPTVAQIIAQAPEVKAYVKNMPLSIQFLQGSDTFSRWGLPPTLFGLADVIVDDSVKVTTKKGAATVTTEFVLGSGAYFVSRPSGLVGVEGGNSFSTIQTFAYEDMTIEQFNDPMNRRIEGRVIDTSTTVIAAPASGYCLAATT